MGVVVGKDGVKAGRVSLTLSKKKKTQLEAHAEQMGVKTAWLASRVIERFLADPTKFEILPSIDQNDGGGDAQH